MKIAFHHIPKTAGTTLIGILDQNFSLNEILPGKYFGKPARDVLEEDILNKSSDLTTYKLIRGHFPAPGFNALSKDYFRITVMRDPSRRLFSLYNDWRSKTDQSLSNAHLHDVKAAELAKKLSIAEFLNQSVHPIPALFDNGQVRLLSNSMTKEKLDESDLAKAKATLDKMQLVGITEMLDSFIKVLCDQCDWIYPNQYQSLNKRSYDLTELEEIDKEILFQYTKLDYQLYNYCKALFSRQLYNHMTRITNASKNLSTNTAIKTDSVKLNMEKGFKCTGFHVREGIGSKDVWRWTGPKTTSSIQFNLKPHLDYKLIIDIISVIDQKIIDGLELNLNGHTLTVKHLGIVRGQQRVTSFIDRDYLHENEADLLNIITPFTVSHAQVQPETNDERQKGIAITNIELDAVR